MKNICHSCKFFEKCVSYRYNNIQTKYMQEIEKEQNKDGRYVIYVKKCKNYVKRNPFKGKMFKNYY